MNTVSYTHLEHILHGQLEKFVLVILHAVNPGEDACSFLSGVICRVIVENELEDRFCIGKILDVYKRQGGKTVHKTVIRVALRNICKIGSKNVGTLCCLCGDVYKRQAAS